MTAATSRPERTVATRNVTAADSRDVATVDTRNARLRWLAERITARDADMQRRAEAGDEFAQWLRSIPAAPANQRAERAFEAAERAEWCARCGRDLDPVEPVWWHGRLGPRRRNVAPVGECCRLPDYVTRDHGWYAQQQACEACGRAVWHRWPSRQPVCCEQHRYKAQAARRSAERHQARADRECVGCGSTFTPARSDARYCSPACRQRAYRRRKDAP